MGKVSVTCPKCNHKWLRKPSTVEQMVGMMGDITLMQKLYLMDPNCGICNKRIKTFAEVTIDHMFPRSKGGIDNWRNYELAHKVCNMRKADKVIEGHGVSQLDIDLRKFEHENRNHSV
jgi:hypothetical protein